MSELNLQKALIVVATQRSGTNLLRSLLVDSKQFVDYKEVFGQKVVDSPNSYFNFRRKLYQENLDYSLPTNENVEMIFQKYLEYLQDKSNNRFILDIKYNSFCHFTPFWHSPSEPPMLVKLIKKYQIPVIHLIRDNVLETECSTELYRKNWIATLREGEQLKYSTVSIDTNTIIKKLNKRNKEIKLFKDYFKNYQYVCTINYAEISKGSLTTQTRNKIYEKFNIEIKEDVTSPLKKMGRCLSETIENYTEVSKLLYNHGFEYLLN